MIVVTLLWLLQTYITIINYIGINDRFWDTTIVQHKLAECLQQVFLMLGSHRVLTEQEEIILWISEAADELCDANKHHRPMLC